MCRAYSSHVVATLSLILLSFCISACKDISTESLKPGATMNGSSGSGSDGGDDGSGSDDSGGSDGDGGEIGGGTDGNGGDGGVISTFKPALAVRATGCIMCHGRVEANMITDFGAGNSYAFGLDYPAGLQPFSGNIYGDHAENWATAKVWGKVFVPTVTAPAPYNNTLKNYLQNKLLPPDASTPAPEVVAKNMIYIGAPTQARILQVAGSFPGSHPQWKSMTAPEATGIELAPGNQYVRNTPNSTLVCNGDLVVNSVLFLNNLQLQTETGCRIYVTKSVFIQGPINFVGTANNRNLQITSSRAIVAGLGPGASDGGAGNTVSGRLQDFWTRFSYATRDNTQSTQEKLDAIVNDSHLIADLLDASSQLPHRRNVSFERVLLNAPNYQSRYQGQFKGVIIAEMAIASLNVFSFYFDSVFERVPILPLLTQADYLRVE